MSFQPASQPAQPVRPDWLSPLPPNLALSLTHSLPLSLPPSLSGLSVPLRARLFLPSHPNLLRSPVGTCSLSLALFDPSFPKHHFQSPSLLRRRPPSTKRDRPGAVLPSTSRTCALLVVSSIHVSTRTLFFEAHLSTTPPISTLGSGPSIFTTHPRFTPSRARLAPPRPRALRLHDHSCSDDDAPSPGLVFSAEARPPFDVSFVCPRVGGVPWVSTESKETGPCRHSTSPYSPRPARLGERQRMVVVDGLSYSVCLGSRLLSRRQRRDRTGPVMTCRPYR